MSNESNSAVLLLVLVNYFNDDEIIRFVTNELLAQNNSEFKIVVVNNGSENEQKLIDNLNKYQVDLLQPDRNCGYIHGFLFAVENYLNRYQSLPPLMVLCNSDMHFISRDFLTSLINRYSQASYAGIGPSIISTRTHTDQNPFIPERITAGKLRFLKMVESNYLFYYCYQMLAVLKGKIKQATHYDGKEKQTIETYAIHGSFMAFRREFITEVLDELKKAPFLFGEEVYIAELARKHNYKLIYDPSMVIEHHEHATTKTFKSRKTLKWMHQSTSQIIDDFFN